METEKNCFNCEYAEVDIGEQMVWRTANGDGYPGSSPEFIGCNCLECEKEMDFLWDKIESNNNDFELESWLNGERGKNCIFFKNKKGKI